MIPMDRGVMIPPIEETTVQKYDMQFGTNVVGTRIATSLLGFRSCMTDVSLLAVYRSLAVHDSVASWAIRSH